MTSQTLQEVRLFGLKAANEDPTQSVGEDDVLTDVDAAEGSPLHGQVQAQLAKMEERSKCWLGGCLIG